MSGAADIELSFDKAHGATAVIHGEHPKGNAFDADVNPYTSHQKGDDDDASVGAESDDERNAILPVADGHGQPAHYPGQEDHHHKAGKKLDDDAKKEAPRSVMAAGLESFKYLYSMGLLIFSVFLVMAAIFAEQTKATSDMGLHPAIAFFVFWFLILWLAI
jgi:hypothetical protein